MGTDDKWIITASHDNTAKVWDTRSGKLIVDITQHTEGVTAAAFVGENRAITCAIDKLLILWEIKEKPTSGLFFS